MLPQVRADRVVEIGEVSLKGVPNHVERFSGGRASSRG